MNEMKTLTLPNGVTYEIVDQKARVDIANVDASNKRDCVAPIVQTVDGTSVIVDNSSDRPVRNLRLFGKTTQITTTGAQLINFSEMKMDTGGTTTAGIIDNGRIVTITGTKSYAMGYVNIDVTPYVGQTLYLTGVKTGGTSPSLTARLIKTNDNKTYITTELLTGYTVLADDATISLQFIANNTTTTLTTATTATFTDVMISAVKDAAWEPYTGGVPAPSFSQPQDLVNVENPVITIKGGNLLPASYADGKSKTMNGVTFDVLSDGSVIVNGTATATAYFSFNTTGKKIALPNGWLSASSGVNCGHGIPHVQNDIYVDGRYIDAVQTAIESSTRRQFFGKVELGGSRVKVDAGVTVVSQRIYPMLCAFENPIDYEPPKQTQSMSIGRTLLGIPVTSGGNYTDDNSQQWICDEIDFERGVHIQRIDRKFFTLNKEVYDYNTIGYRYTCHVGSDVVGANECMSTTLRYNPAVGTAADTTDGVRINKDSRYIVAQYTGDGGASEIIDVDLLYILANPIETPLTEEEIAAFNTLYTHKTNTSVINDVNAWMEMEYSKDVRMYIRDIVYDDAYELVDEVVTQDKIQVAVNNWLNEHFASAEGVSF